MCRILVGLLLLLTSCGKVGDPLPPFIRIPEPVSDLTAVQTGYDLILTWTNPARNIDGSIATDLGKILVFRNGVPAETVDVSAAGQRQSYSIPARPLIGTAHTFAVQAQTKVQKLSAISNAVSINPVEVPGRVADLRSIVDQNRILVEWNLPLERSELANVYVVVKSGGVPGTEVPVLVTERKFEDVRYETGKTYTYNVTAARRMGESQTLGIGGEPLTVIAIDRTPPRPPTDLEIVASDDGAFLKWTANSETDLAGYRVFRGNRPDADFTPLKDSLNTTNALFDPDYRSGLYYTVSTVDEFGNESRMSAPYRAP